MIPPTTAETSEEILMSLQKSIDPEPLNPAEFSCFYPSVANDTKQTESVLK